MRGLSALKERPKAAHKTYHVMEQDGEEEIDFFSWWYLLQRGYPGVLLTDQEARFCYHAHFSGSEIMRLYQFRLEMREKQADEERASRPALSRMPTEHPWLLGV